MLDRVSGLRAFRELEAEEGNKLQWCCHHYATTALYKTTFFLFFFASVVPSITVVLGRGEYALSQAR